MEGIFIIFRLLNYRVCVEVDIFIFFNYLILVEWIFVIGLKSWYYFCIVLYDILLRDFLLLIVFF